MVRVNRGTYRTAGSVAGLLAILVVERASGQADTARVAPMPRAGAAFRIPLASLLVPGIGQYVLGAPVAGAAFTGTAAVGYLLYFTGDTSAVSLSNLPRSWDGRRSLMGIQIAGGAGMLSAYDAFHRSLAPLQREGKYAFVQRHATTSELLYATFDPKPLGRWTTWLGLAYTAGVTALVVELETEPGTRYAPFGAGDATLVGVLSYGAGVGEEALFRGWLFPVLHQNLRQRFWLSNSIQAAIFGSLHLPQASGFAAVIGAWGFYQGWLTRRNQWDIRESIFQHFWYDVAVATTTLLTEGRAAMAVSLPLACLTDDGR